MIQILVLTVFTLLICQEIVFGRVLILLVDQTLQFFILRIVIYLKLLMQLLPIAQDMLVFLSWKIIKGTLKCAQKHLSIYRMVLLIIEDRTQQHIILDNNLALQLFSRKWTTDQLGCSQMGQVLKERLVFMTKPVN
jgi:hypothetical protein